ncbi:MAG: bifunctional phosphoribosylaminoimidazolecarboxamide formyltransferase/IMP cyclohydrolase [Actinomycetota bacterium]|nr:bifunctional phosphoribosylaminoimidazolecarboxamide formyltransferase/IMP cyclohydrolase [Actinomycetota bacterium]
MATALLSVYDKSGIADLAAGLHELGWRLLSSGGTAQTVAARGTPVTDVAELTGLPAILGHRVVTLHPNVHGGILADLDDPDHQRDLVEHGIEPIGLVVVNLYPFASAPGVELIDIGGPAMVRAAAKNHAHVGVVVDPADYDPVLAELRADDALSAGTRRRLARTAFATTAAYDREIVEWLDAPCDPADTTAGAEVGDPMPETLSFDLVRVQSLRYGENPHQRAARYRVNGASGWWDTCTQHGGKALSYLNLYDAEAAWRLVHRFDEPACVIVKHANPCGVAVHTDVVEAYRRANTCDPVSAFGGVVAVNRPVPGALAEALAPVFTEVVVAPAFDGAALDALAAKQNLRVLSAAVPSPLAWDVRPVDGGLLVQQPDPVRVDRSGWRVVTAARPTAAQWDDLQFAWTVCAAVSSNAIVLAKDRQAFGIGAGQQNRVDSARIALARADGRATGGACASDAFFPFRDGLDVAADAGITAIIQPGGSVRDDEVIAAAEERGIAMVFTGERHFRH